MEATLRRIQELAGKSKVPLVLLVIPSPIDACDQFDLGQVDLQLYPGYRRETLCATLADTARRVGIPCLNLFEPIRQRKPKELYLHDDVHWNNAGQRLAADLLTEFLIENDLIPETR